ncbi:hypothetical protein Tco_0832035 [Tanacetum coccineum]
MLTRFIRVVFLHPLPRGGYVSIPKAIPTLFDVVDLFVAVVGIRYGFLSLTLINQQEEEAEFSHSARRHVEAEAELVANHKKDLRLKVPRQTLLEGESRWVVWLVAALLWRRRWVVWFAAADKKKPTARMAEKATAVYGFPLFAVFLDIKHTSFVAFGLMEKLSYHIDVSRTDLVAILLEQLQGNHENTVNKKVMSMFENTEDEYTDLISKNIIKVQRMVTIGVLRQSTTIKI